MQNFTDEALARIIRIGSDEDKLAAWGFLYERYHHRILRFTGSLIGGSSAADAAHDTMLAFYNWARNPKNELPRCVGQVLFTIARRRCNAMRNKARRYVPLPVHLADFDYLEEYVDLQEKKKLIRVFLMEQLRGREREVWVYRKLLDLPASEVALIFGISRDNVNTTLNHANDKWKLYLRTIRVLPER